MPFAAARPSRLVHVALAAALMSVGCGRHSAEGVRFEVVAEAAPPLVWPAAPERARIKHLASVARPIDVGAKPSLARRLLSIFTGGTEARVRQPYGVAVDSAGRLYVADRSARGMHIFDAQHGRYEFRDRTGRTKFVSPVGVAVDAGGGSYLTDSELRMVFHLDAAGREVWRIASGPQRPTGVALDRLRGLLYVIDTQGHQVFVYDTTGTLRRKFGTRGSGPGEFNFPTNVVVTPTGVVYITDSMNFRVQAFAPNGKFAFEFGKHGDAVGDFERAKGIAVDSNGHLYVVDGLHDVVNMYDGSGRLLLSFGRAGHGRGDFWLATGIAIDRNDRVFVADSFNGRVQVFQYLAGPQ